MLREIVVATAVAGGLTAGMVSMPTASASPQYPLYCSDEAPYPPPYSPFDTMCTIMGHGVQGRWASTPQQIAPTWQPGPTTCGAYDSCSAKRD